MAARVFGAVPRIGPFPGGTRVYMDELAFRVVTHAAGPERKRSISQLHRWNARNPEIQCIAFDVL